MREKLKDQLHISKPVIIAAMIDAASTRLDTLRANLLVEKESLDRIGFSSDRGEKAEEYKLWLKGITELKEEIKELESFLEWIAADQPRLVCLKRGDHAEVLLRKGEGQKIPSCVVEYLGFQFSNGVPLEFSEISPECPVGHTLNTLESEGRLQAGYRLRLGDTKMMVRWVL